MITVQSISSGGYLVTNNNQNGRTTYCATFDALVATLQAIYGIQTS